MIGLLKTDITGPLIILISIQEAVLEGLQVLMFDIKIGEELIG